MVAQSAKNCPIWSHWLEHSHKRLILLLCSAQNKHFFLFSNLTESTIDHFQYDRAHISRKFQSRALGHKRRNILCIKLRQLFSTSEVEHVLNLGNKIYAQENTQLRYARIKSLKHSQAVLAIWYVLLQVIFIIFPFKRTPKFCPEIPNLVPANTKMQLLQLTKLQI